MKFLRILTIALNLLFLITIGVSVVQYERGNQVYDKYYACNLSTQYGDYMACDAYSPDLTIVPLSAQHLYNSQHTYRSIYLNVLAGFSLLTFTEFVYIGIKNKKKYLARLGFVGILFLTWLLTTILSFFTLSALGESYTNNNGKYMVGYTVPDHILILLGIVVMAGINFIIYRYNIQSSRKSNQKGWSVYIIISLVINTPTTIFAIVANFIR